MTFSGLWTSEKCVVQPTCLPLMQEITGAKPVRDASFMPPPQSSDFDGESGVPVRWPLRHAAFRLPSPAHDGNVSRRSDGS